MEMAAADNPLWPKPTRKRRFKNIAYMDKIRDEAPDGIIVTLPARFFKEYDHETYLKEIQEMNADEEKIWYRVMSRLPLLDCMYVYTIVDNKVHHRALFAGLVRHKNLFFTRQDGSRRNFPNANAFMMCGPIVMAPEEIAMRGFQGFRYTHKLF
jgi:hypothetical protein